VECIKIDKSFISSMGSSAGSLALIRTFVQFGRHLGLKTLAEGVETTTEMELLTVDHVNEANGYLFSGPLGPEALETQLFEPKCATDTSSYAVGRIKESVASSESSSGNE
jgi:EAL domain-containing protein (putative c-di-GMP-specific phosphodiesterase class I)